MRAWKRKFCLWSPMARTMPAARPWSRRSSSCRRRTARQYTLSAFWETKSIPSGPSARLRSLPSAPAASPSSLRLWTKSTRSAAPSPATFAINMRSATNPPIPEQVAAFVKSAWTPKLKATASWSSVPRAATTPALSPRPAHQPRAIQTAPASQRLRPPPRRVYWGPPCVNLRLAPRPLQHLARRIHQRRFILQHLSHALDLLLSLGVFLLLDPLPNPRYGFHVVTRVNARSVQQVFIPSSPRKPLFIGELAFTFDEQSIQSPERLRLSVPKRRLLFRQSLVVPFRAARQLLHGILHGRKVQVRWNLLPRRRHGRPPRIECGFEHSFVQFLIALPKFVL